MSIIDQEIKKRSKYRFKKKTKKKPKKKIVYTGAKIHGLILGKNINER